MAFAKLRSLYVRPIESADLAFNTAGIIGSQNRQLAKLGNRLDAFDVDSFLTSLSVSDKGNPGRLTNDSVAIRKALSTGLLFSLRNDILEATLQQILMQREVAYYEKFAHRDLIAKAISEIYPEKSNGKGKVERLIALSNASEARRNKVTQALQASPGFNEVVKGTNTNAQVGGSTTSTTMTTPVAMDMPTHTITVSGDGGNSTHTMNESPTIPQSYQNGAWANLTSGELGFKSQQTVTSNAVQQTSTTTSADFRHPILENAMRDIRTQVDLQDELLLQKTYSFRTPYIAKNIDRELAIIDYEIKKTQLRFVQTFLVSPISGIVTALYKDVGEAVQPGEAVLRVENDSRILLVTILNYSSAIYVGMKATIKTSGVYESSDSFTTNGTVVSVRGHDPDDNEWDIIIEADNKQRLPLNYHFDRDTTTCELS